MVYSPSKYIFGPNEVPLEQLAPAHIEEISNFAVDGFGMGGSSLVPLTVTFADFEAYPPGPVQVNVYVVVWVGLTD